MNNNKNTLLGGFAALALVAAVSVMLNKQSNDEFGTADTTNIENTSVNQAASSEPTTIANAWQWHPDDQSAPGPQVASDVDTRTPSVADNDDALPFTNQSVYQALQEVKIDADGDIILDHAALLSLDEALERMYGKLDEDKLSKLKALIEHHLPGSAGQQTAEIVENYTNYLVAKDEFSRVYESVPANEEQTLETLTRDESLYGELRALREVYLGTEQTEQLFRITDANAQMMFDSLKVTADTSLSPEQKSDLLKEVQEVHARATIDITDWTNRYDSFLEEKESILNAAISESDKESQLKTLYQDRFDEAEQAKISHLTLDML